MKLNQLRDNPGAAQRRKRVGRGPGSGKGKTAGRGMKGQKSRSGVALGAFEGGQMPLYQRLPKRGFRKPHRRRFAVVNLGRLQEFIAAKKIDASKPIDEATLVASGLVRRLRDGVRILAGGEFATKVEIRASGASQAAISAVSKAGGTLSVSESAMTGKSESGKANDGMAEKRRAGKTEAPKSEKGEAGKADGDKGKSADSSTAATEGENGDLPAEKA